ncbi:MAG: NAD(P)-dependent oxidoreductase [Planctomycetes bacterium]|nr:NAD(P)-dependent oxidoreductase [Planctomycetota bacterium]
MRTFEAYDGARVLVLGGSGFIGRWVASVLASKGAKVIVVARDVARTKSLLAEDGARCEVRAYDLARRGELAALLDVLRPAVVFNLVGYGVDPSERDEALAVRLNSELVAELAEAVKPDSHWRGQALVHVGSALEFGTMDGNFTDPWACAPTTLYGRTKLEGSRNLREISVRRGLKAFTARLFTVYGPGEHNSRLVPTLLAASRESAPIPLTAGLQRRDFTFVSDVAHGLLRLALTHDPVPERAFNFATGSLTPVRQFVETAARVFGIERERLQFGALPTRAEEMSHDPVSISALERRLNWKPSTTIEQGLTETLAFERRNGRM